MSSESPQGSKRLNLSESEKALFSEQKSAFIEDLECLYIKNNHGARLNFLKKWPVAAEKILPAALIRFDQEGVFSDEQRSLRTTLEQDAETNRLAMVDIFSNLTARLVIHGSLQIEELKNIMGKIDRPLALYVFEKGYVDRYLPENFSVHYDPETQNAIRAPSEKSVMATPPENDDAPQPPLTDLSISGHADHSLSITPPKTDFGYKRPSDLASARIEPSSEKIEEAMDWLENNTADLMDDVMPIMTLGAPTPSPAPELKMPMGLRAYQKDQDTVRTSDSQPEDQKSVQPEDTERNYPPIPGSETEN